MALKDIMFFRDDEYNVVIKQNLVTPEDGEIKEVKSLISWLRG